MKFRTTICVLLPKTSTALFLSPEKAGSGRGLCAFHGKETCLTPKSRVRRRFGRKNETDTQTRGSLKKITGFDNKTDKTTQNDVI